MVFGGLCAAVLVLSGIGIGTVGAGVIGMSKLAGAGETVAGSAGAVSAHGSGVPVTGPKTPAPSPRNTLPPQPRPRPPAATLGIEAVDAPRSAGAGALLVGVHVPGPGHAAGLVRGDTVVVFGGTRIGSAAELAAQVGRARAGRTVTLTVRHESGARQVLAARPGVVT
ncbi:PDZ domain-containing protein [Streptomyces venezuelae]|uniref:PDZ domain-containing protein n=2 Tax=Streptomyces venezuelae TaxID=54571 RepID=A0A5P2CNF6_STRVZ|nr:PDZ domain-containing protein [Streptomyces venezuelae]